MFAKNSKAYSVYLLFRFVCSLAVSMSTVLSIVYHLEVVQLDAFQLVLVGTVLETSCFLFEIPTGVVADLDLCQYFEHKKLKGYADFFNSSSSFCCGVI